MFQESRHIRKYCELLEINFPKNSYSDDVTANLLSPKNDCDLRIRSRIARMAAPATGYSAMP